MQFMATLLLVPFTPMQYVLRLKHGDFPPFKYSSPVEVSESNNQSAAVHKVIIHKSVIL